MWNLAYGAIHIYSLSAYVCVYSEIITMSRNISHCCHIYHICEQLHINRTGYSVDHMLILYYYTVLLLTSQLERYIIHAYSHMVDLSISEPRSCVQVIEAIDIC